MGAAGWQWRAGWSLEELTLVGWGRQHIGNSTDGGNPASCPRHSTPLVELKAMALVAGSQHPAHVPLVGYVVSPVRV